jgi:predicted nucleic acid-binding protein
MERAPQTLVLDASAAVKWFLKEEDTQKAVELRDAHLNGRVNLTSPDLIVYEVANALNYHPKLSEPDIQAYMRELSNYQLDLVAPSKDFVAQAVTTAKTHEISIYDASYLALSEIIGTNLVTADTKLQAKAAKKTNIYLLSEMGRTWTLT